MKQLHVALVVDGTVAHDVCPPDGTTVSIGTDSSCTLTLSAPSVPSTAVILWEGGRYWLLLNALDNGRLAIDEGIVEVAELKKRGDSRVKLSEGSRGRVQVLGYTVLFRFGVPDTETPNE